jgi:hypothetical protein
MKRQSNYQRLSSHDDGLLPPSFSVENLSSVEAENSSQPLWIVNLLSLSGTLPIKSIEISSEATIKQLYQLLLEKLNINQSNQLLRLFFHGKLLSSSTMLGHVLSTELKNGCFLHIAISPKPLQTHQQSQQPRHQQKQPLISSFLSASIPSASLTVPSSSSSSTSSMRPSSPASSSSPLHGFNLLSLPRNPYGVVLSSEEISILRALYSSSVQQYAILCQERREDNENLEEYQARLEEDWMAEQSPFSEFRINLSLMGSSNNDIEREDNDEFQQHRSYRQLTILDFMQQNNPFSSFFFSPHAAISNHDRQQNESPHPGLVVVGEDVSTERTMLLPPSTSSASSSSSPIPEQRRQQSTVTADATTTVYDESLGTWSDFLYGLTLGYLIGFLLLFCIWDRNISYRQKLGFLLGIMISLLSSVLWSYHSGSEGSFRGRSNNSGTTTGHEATGVLQQDHHHHMFTASSNSSLRGSVEVITGSEIVIPLDQRHTMFSTFPFPFSI